MIKLTKNQAINIRAILQNLENVRREIEKYGLNLDSEYASSTVQTMLDAYKGLLEIGLPEDLRPK